MLRSHAWKKEQLRGAISLCALKKNRLKYVSGFVLLWFPGEAFTRSFKAPVNVEHVFRMPDMFSMFLDLRMY